MDNKTALAEQQRAKRNLNPTKAAVVAMFIYHEDYAKSRLGSMDFWDLLDAHQKFVCENCVDKIEAAR